MELKNDFFQYISRIHIELLTKIFNDKKESDEIEANIECRRVIFYQLFLLYSRNAGLTPSTLEIFTYNEEIFNKNELNSIIIRLRDECKKRYSIFFSSYDNFLSCINGLQQHFMSSENLGSVYTPPMIVKYMVKEIIENYFNKINFKQINNEKEISNILKEIKILDPSMGTGIFLIEMLNQLNNYIIKNLPVEIKVDPIFLKKKILKNSLFGVDLDLISLEIARFFLFLNINNDLESLKDLKSNFIQANTLTDQIFSGKIDEFSIIIGNPPYIRSDDLVKSQPKLLDIYKNKFKDVIAAGQKSDIYFFFIKRSAELLKSNGIISFIVPNRFLTNVYAEKLREFMLKNLQMIQIVDFSEFQDAEINRIFKNIEVFPSIFIAEKSNNTRKIIIKQPKNIKELREKAIGVSQQKFIDFDNLIVITNDKIKLLMLDILLDKTKFRKLGSVVTFGEGLRGKTISKIEYEELTESEKRNFIREIRGKNVRKFRLDGFNGYYKLKKDRIYYDNLIKQVKKNDLKKINLTNEAEQFLKRIVISEMGSELRAVLIDSGEFAYGGTYFTTEYRSKTDLRLLLGLLNSSIINLLFDLIYKSTKWGTSFKFRARYLEKIPIPILNEENSHLRNRIIEIVKNIIENPNNTSNIKELDKLIFQWYGIPLELIS